MAEHSTDILVVGAGPAGLYTAYYAGSRGLRTVVIDSLPEPGGQVSTPDPEQHVYDIAGFPSVRGRELIAQLTEQASRFNPTYLLGEQAHAPRYGTDGRIEVTTDSGHRVHCAAVIITGGIGTFTRRRLPVGSRYEGRGLSYFVPDLAEHAGREVVIVGGGHSAFAWALALHPITRSVTVVHRREVSRAHPHTVRQAKESGVEVLPSCTVTSVAGAREVESVDVRHVPSGTVRTLAAQRIIVALGFTADLGPLQAWGLATQEGMIRVDSRMSTNLAGVFAAGDIATYPGKVRLIAVGFREAATAVNNAAVLLDPTQRLRPGQSADAA